MRRLYEVALRTRGMYWADNRADAESLARVMAGGGRSTTATVTEIERECPVKADGERGPEGAD